MKNINTFCLIVLLFGTQAFAQKNFKNQLSINAIAQKEIHKIDSQFYANYQLLKAAGKPMTQSNYGWNDTSLSWVLVQNIYYMYTPSGKMARTQYLNANAEMNFEYLYEYDQDDRLSSTTARTRYNPNNVLMNDSREEYAYDAQNRMVLRLIKVWNAQTSSWMEDQRVLTVYGQDNYIQEYRIDQKISGNWVSQYGYKMNNLYQNNQLTRTIFEDYNSQHSRYDTSYQYLYTYQNNLVTSRVYQNYDWRTGNFNDVERIDLTYNTSNQVNSITNYLHDSIQFKAINKTDSITWYNYTNDMYFEIDFYNIKSYVLKTFDETNNQFINSEKYLKTKLDTNGSFEDAFFTWDSTNTWLLSQSNIINIDDYKNIKLNIRYLYVAGIPKIDHGYRRTNYYNSNGDYIENITEFYDTQINDYRKTSRIVFSNFTGINNETNNLFSIYPNPSSGEFFIQLNSKKANIKIYDSLGRIIRNISSDESVERIQLAEKGIYFVEVDGIVEKVIIN